MPPLVRFAIALSVPFILAVLPIKLQPNQLKQLACLFWIFGGMVLLSRAVSFLQPSVAPLLQGVALPSEVWVALGLSLVVGLLKGQFVLKKSCQRNVARIASLTEPAKPFHVYDIRSWVVILLMIGLSVLVQQLGLPDLVRGSILLTVGIALLRSSLFYRAPLAMVPTVG
jgi:hypothetical protein